MIIKIEDARVCYDEIIKKSRRKKNSRVILFVGFDVDSLCALRLLITLFRMDNIKFEVIPVLSFDQLNEKINDYKKPYEEKRDISSIIMINCGGTIDLTEHWFASQFNDLLIFVIDSNRPTNHNNIYHNNIIFIDDSKYNLDDVPKAEDLKEIKELESDGDDDEEEDYLNAENVSIDEAEDDLVKEKEEFYGEESSNNKDKENENENFYGEESKDNKRKNNISLSDNENFDGDKDYIYNMKKENDDKDMDIYKDNDKDNYNDKDKDKEKNKKKRLKKKREHLDDIEIKEENFREKDNNYEEDDELSKKKQKRSAVIDEKIMKKTLKKKKKMKIANYYAGKYYGYPSTFIIYNIIIQHNRDDNQCLWLLIVSLTDNYIQSHISEDSYSSLRSYCLKEVLRLNKNINNNNGEVINKVLNAHGFNEDEGKELSKLIKSNNKEMKTISQELDYKLFLYKHWNLFDSFVYSSYTLACLQTWKEEGKREIQKILAYMGIPLKEAKQKYAYMKNEYKNIFKEKIMEISRKFDMKDLLFESFVYQMDQKTQISACDFVHGINAIIEHPFNSIKELSSSMSNENIEKFEENLEEGGENLDSKNNGDTGGDGEEFSTNGNNRGLKINHFWSAYEYLGLKNTKLVKTSFELAINFQISLVNNGTAVIDKRKINPSSNFRYAIINNDMSDDIKYFHNPLSIEKLSLFIMNIYHKSKFLKSLEIKPFVLALLNSKNKSYYIAGVLSHDNYNDKNDFSMRFRVSARNLQAKIVYNTFNDCVVGIIFLIYFYLFDFFLF
jgi:cell division control protein 45